MGETSERIKRRVRDTATQQLEAAKESAGEFVERAKTVAEREGVTTSGAAAEIVRRFSGDAGEEQGQTRGETDDGAAGGNWPEDTQRRA